MNTAREAQNFLISASRFVSVGGWKRAPPLRFPACDAIDPRYGVLLITRTRCFGAFGAMFDGGTFEFPGNGAALVLPGFVLPGMGSGTGAACGMPCGKFTGRGTWGT